MSKAYHVELKEPIDGQKHFYFGSQTAIFDILSSDQVGISLNSLLNNHKFVNGDYHNKKCTIRLGKLIRTKTNRGKNNERGTNIKDAHGVL